MNQATAAAPGAYLRLFRFVWGCMCCVRRSIHRYSGPGLWLSRNPLTSLCGILVVPQPPAVARLRRVMCRRASGAVTSLA